MLLKMGFGRKWAAQMSRFIPIQKTHKDAYEHDEALNQELYESIAVGNALADAEEMANRYWRRS